MTTSGPLIRPEETPKVLRRAWRVWAERLFLAVVLLLFVVKGFIPAWRHLNSDFPNYYLVARLYRAGYPLDRVYEWIWLQREKDHQGMDQGVITFVPLTLPSALVVAPLSSLSPLAAKRCWLFVNVLFLFFTAWLLTRCTSLSRVRVALLMSLAFVALRNNFLLGQMHVLVLLLITLAAWLYFRKSHFLSGISLAAAAALKLYPGLFLLFFIFKRQWRAAAGLVAGLLGSALLSLYLFGRDSCLVFVREILPAALRGETVDPYHVAWGSISTLLRRLFIAEPELNPAPLAHLPWLYALLQPAIHSFIFVLFMWAMGRKEGDDHKIKTDWAIYLFLLLFLSSQPAGYHFVALILTTVLIYEDMIAQGRSSVAGAMVVVYTLICIATIHLPSASPTGWHTLLFFPRLYMMAVFGAILFYWMFAGSAESFRSHINARSTGLATIILILLVTVGFFSTRRHLCRQFENYKYRVLTTPDSLFASYPVVTSDGVLASAMTTAGYGGYTIRRSQDRSTVELSRTDGDWFHPSASQQTNVIWAEQASRKGSRIVRLLNEPSLAETPRTILQTEDAEEPVVSPDGKFLAFFREMHGLNTLWIQGIAPAETPSSIVEAHELAGPQYDPRDATFLPDGRVLFSSKRTGHFLLYVVTQSGVVEEFKRPACSARYPAVSPDGRWLAFSCDEGGNWQMHAIELAGSQELRLTQAECNSITPAWTSDSKRIIYSTDCGRGVGLTALAEITAIH
jgi:hypothetical protein